LIPVPLLMTRILGLGPPPMLQRLVEWGDIRWLRVL
jgi:hypothetical protein